MAKVLTYEEKNTWIHKLSGVTKLIFFLLWCITSMISYDTRVLACMIVISFAVFYMSKTKWKQVGAVFKIVLVFLAFNVVAIFLFSPDQGTKIYGTKTVVCHLFGRYDLTKEQLFYELNVVMKYFTVVPAVFMFLVTTNPSEFAASLNRVGLGYNAGFAISLAIRYIPDVQNEFVRIRNAQEARGIEMTDKKSSLIKRIKNSAAIIFPLLFTSMDRIDLVSNAMELRGYGKHKTRTWYMERKLERNDYLVICFSVIFTAAALLITFIDGNRFFNPFI